MKFGWMAAASLAAMLAGSADATIVSLNFAGGGFSGSFSFDDADNALKSIDFNQAGKVYDLTNTGFFAPDFYDGWYLGGILTGVSGVQSSPTVTRTEENDFVLVFSRDFQETLLLTQTAMIGFEVNAPTLTLASVPEPGTWGLFIGGFGLIGAAMRRRQITVRFS